MSSFDAYPDFFERHGYLPRGVSAPTEVTDWELAHLGRLPFDHPLSTELRYGTEMPVAGRLDRGEPTAEGHVEVERLVESFGEDAREDDAQWLADAGLSPCDPFSFNRWSGEPIADAVAAYLPWHFFGDQWGVEIYGDAFEQLVVDLHAFANQMDGGQGPYLSLHVVADWVFDAVLTHELFHMRSEIAGTLLESQFKTSLVRDHQLLRYVQPNPWTTGPLEELLATWADASVPLGSDRLTRAYRWLLAGTGPGYRDWEMAEPARQREAMFTTLLSDIAGRPVPGVQWPAPLSEDELASVPLRWFGVMTGPMFVRPKVAPLTLREFKSYLAHHGIPVESGGNHPHFRVGNRKCPFPTSKGRGTKILPHNVLSSIASVLGFSTPAQLREAVRKRDIQPPAIALLSAAH